MSLEFPDPETQTSYYREAQRRIDVSPRKEKTREEKAMSKEDFISHMRELIYRVNAPAAKTVLEDALDLYERDLPSVKDQQRLEEASKLREEASQLRLKAESLEAHVKAHYPPQEVEVQKSVDEVISEIAKQNNGIVKRDGL